MTAVPTWRAQRVRFDDVERLRAELDIPEVLAWALARRGLGDPAAAREFLAADGPLAPPEAIAGIPEAAARITRAIERRERIVVHGDYDCDGVCSTAVLLSALRARGADVRHMLPSRFAEGYGVAVATVERLADEGCRLLVCVDCGTSAVDALARATDLGMESVVLDHHLAGGDRPAAIIANPALGRPADDLPAAAGVVHALARALGATGPGGLLGPDPDGDLDLVALATVADAVPLVGDNRRIVVRGLERMRRTPRPGIAALCAAAGVEPRTLSARSLGFTIAPCINAAGRLAHPDRALELLLAADMDAAMPVAEELWELNIRRRDVERAIVDEAIAMVEAEPPAIRDAGAVVAAGDGWHEGVVGIVASRLVEHFGRPAIVIARDGDRAKGSGRSLPGVDLHALVGGASGALARWGGHAGAVGLELRSERIAEFRDDLHAAADGMRAAIDRARVRTVDAVASCPDLTLEVAEALERLAPFGRGNPAVRLAVPAVRVADPRRVGQGKHLEVRLHAGGAHARGIGFQMGARAPGLDCDGRYDAVVALEVERWQGVVGPRVNVRALDAVPAHDDGDWPLPCALDAPERDPLRAELLDAAYVEPVAPAPAAAPRAVRDLRGSGAGVGVVTGLAGADGGVVVVVADAARRATALRTVLSPARTGVEAVAVVDAHLRPEAVDRRLRALDGRPAFIVADYRALACAPLPPDVHLAVIDPPALPEDAAALMHAAAGRWLHLLWGEDDVAPALAAVADAWDVRPCATAAWRALRDGTPRPYGPDLDAAVLGAGGTTRAACVAARALRALAEIGMLEVTASGIRARADAPRRPLDDAPTHRAGQERIALARRRLERWDSLDPRDGGRIGTARGIVHA